MKLEIETSMVGKRDGKYLFHIYFHALDWMQEFGIQIMKRKLKIKRYGLACAPLRKLIEKHTYLETAKDWYSIHYCIDMPKDRYI